MVEFVAEVNPRGQRNLLVNYIPNSMLSMDLRHLFEPFGAIVHCKVVMDKVTGASAGYGFVKYLTEQAAMQAISALNGFQLHGKTLKVSLALKKTARAKLPVLKNTDNCFPEQLSAFRLERVINDGSQDGIFCALGRFPIDETSSLVRFCQLPLQMELLLDSENLTEASFAGIVNENNQFNDTALLSGTSPSLPCKVSVQIVRPALPNLITKYTASPYALFRETTALYLSITLPWLVGPSNDAVSLRWIHDMLAGNVEADRLCLTTPAWMVFGFSPLGKILPNGLRLLALFRGESLLSIRDLRREHVPMLCEFREAIYSWIASQWHVCPELLRVFFRYPPSYAHLHIHIYDLTVSVVHVKDILLDDVIDWLSHDDAYFERASLSVLVSQESPLWEEFCRIQLPEMKRSDLFSK